ncbi:MAG: hypothetical protein AAF289_11920 [Cyanobacteria bacterium P01_A01_bin.135]
MGPDEMDYLWHRLLRKSYRRYPIPSVIFTMGLVDIAIAGANLRWPLLIAGSAMAAIALVLHAHQRRRWGADDAPSERLQPPSAPS